MRFKSLLAALTISVAAVLPASAETYKHARGEIEINEVPARVVVFDPAVIDNLTALGVSPIGVPGGNMLPHIAARLPADVEAVGTLFEPDYEAVAALEPDLIIVAGRAAPKYDDLAKIAPTMDLTVGREGFLDTARGNLEMLGRIFGKEAKAEELLAALTTETEGLKAAAPNAGRVLVMLTAGSRMSAHGAGSRFGILHDDYGLTAAATGLDTGNHGQAISNEFIAETNPDWLFVIDRDAAIGTKDAIGAKKLLDNDLVNKTKAAQAGQILFLDSGAWYVAPAGITSLTEGARAIREAISK